MHFLASGQSVEYFDATTESTEMQLIRSHSSAATEPSPENASPVDELRPFRRRRLPRRYLSLAVFYL